MKVRLPIAGRHGLAAGQARRLNEGRRRGLTLMEVIVSLAIFLLAFVGLHMLVNMSGERALDVQEQSEAAHRCQSKMAEVIAGAVPLQSQSDTAFDDDPNYTWSMECDQSTVANLWTVHVHVTRQRKDGVKVESSLSEMVLDPSIRGSTFDTVSISVSSSSSSGSGSQGGTSTPGGSSTPGGGGGAGKGKGGGAGKGKGGTTTPAGGAGKGKGGTTTPGSGAGKGGTTTPGKGGPATKGGP